MARRRSSATRRSRTRSSAPDTHARHTRCSVLGMPRTNSVGALLFCVILLLGIGIAYAGYGTFAAVGSATVLVVSFIAAIFVARAICIAQAWERVVVLRLGKFRALRGPGLFGIIPIVDAIPYTIDIRTITSSFKAEKTLTKDTVPVDVDAV